MAEESDAALVLTTGVRRPGPAAAALLLSAGAFALGIVVLTRVPDVASGPERVLWLLGAGALFAGAVPGVTYGLAGVLEWARTRRRPRPAVRFSGRGIDYSAAYRGTFDRHLAWADVEDCGVVRGPRGRGRFWCVTARGLAAPVAIDLDLAEGASPAEVDLRIREWSGGRCRLPDADGPVRRRRWWPAVDRA
jgi:hypothetical protein